MWISVRPPVCPPVCLTNSRHISGKQRLSTAKTLTHRVCVVKMNHRDGQPSGPRLRAGLGQKIGPGILSRDRPTRY